MFFRRDIVATDTALIGHTFTLNKPHGIFSPSILRLVHQRGYIHEASGVIGSRGEKWTNNACDCGFHCFSIFFRHSEENFHVQAD